MGSHQPKPGVGELIKAGLWVFAALVVLSYVLSKAPETYRLMRAGGETFAEVIETTDEQVEDERGRGGYVTIALYRFEVGDRSYLGSAEGSHGRWEAGDRIPVQYNPSNPAENRRKGDGAVLERFTIFLLVGGVFAYLATTANWSVLREGLSRRGSGPPQT